MTSEPAGLAARRLPQRLLRRAAMAAWIDDLARSMASGLSRREVVRRLSCGLTAGLLAPMVPNRAEAVRAGCATGQTLCNGTCVNTQTNPNNCGACGSICPAGGACKNGACASGSCPSGETRCRGTCVNLLTNAQNCGTCGTACPAGQSCQNG